MLPLPGEGEVFALDGGVPLKYQLAPSADRSTGDRGIVHVGMMAAAEGEREEREEGLVVVVRPLVRSCCLLMVLVVVMAAVMVVVRMEVKVVEQSPAAAPQ